MRVLLVIPAYNEEKNILSVTESINKYNKENKSKYDFVVINDGSTDHTEEVLVKNKINHICLLKNLGIGGAVQTGFKYAYDNDYDIAIQFDGDGQHDINYVKDLVAPIIQKESDMVIGSRFIDKDSVGFKSSSARRFGIKIISFFIKLVTRKKILDTTSGFRAINKNLIEAFAKEYPAEYPEPVSTTEVLKKGYSVKEVPVTMKERTNGVSSIRTWKNCYYMMNVVLSILVVGLRRYKK